MITTIIVDLETDPQDLKKLFRKKLMTGGAVIRLDPSLSAEQLHDLFDCYAPKATAHSLFSMVLVEIAKAPNLPEDLREALDGLGLINVERSVAEKRVSGI